MDWGSIFSSTVIIPILTVIVTAVAGYIGYRMNKVSKTAMAKNAMAEMEKKNGIRNQVMDLIQKNVRSAVESNMQLADSMKQAGHKLDQEEIKALADRARVYIPQRVAYYAPLLGVQPGRITIRTQKTRWGSCSAKGNLNFNCLLMLSPPEVIDGVVVHELCHLLEMNHSNKFYQHVLRVFPEYYKHHAWLRQHGPEIMARGHSVV